MGRRAKICMLVAKKDIILSLELEFPINLDANVKHPFFPLNSVILKCFVTLEENTSTRRQSQSQNVAMPR